MLSIGSTSPASVPPLPPSIMNWKSREWCYSRKIDGQRIRGLKRSSIFYPHSLLPVKKRVAVANLCLKNKLGMVNKERQAEIHGFHDCLDTMSFTEVICKHGIKKSHNASYKKKKIGLISGCSSHNITAQSKSEPGKMNKITGPTLARYRDGTTWLCSVLLCLNKWRKFHSGPLLSMVSSAKPAFQHSSRFRCLP